LQDSRSRPSPYASRCIDWCGAACSRRKTGSSPSPRKANGR
jgi:hypothetical protein